MSGDNRLYISWLFVFSSLLECGLCRYRQIDLSAREVTCRRSTLFSTKFFGTSPDCEGAINGNRGTVWTPTRDSHPNCFYTRQNDQTPFWRLDLGYPRNIHRITIYPELKWDYMRNIRVYVNDDEVFRFPNAKSQINVPQYIDLEIKARYITLRHTANHYVTLCELQVEDCEPGRYGTNCSGICAVGCDVTTCDTLSGHCACRPAWEYPECLECANNYYRYNNDCVPCGRGCETGICDNDTGHCICIDGWQAPLCHTCEPGRYGPDCQNACSDGCLNATCDSQDGQCSCKTGWTGPLCQECENGMYGSSCNKTCSPGCSNACDKMEGSCYCNHGWEGPRCDECSPGHYRNASAGPAFCLKCGEGCDTGSCDDVTGNCSCRAGWQEPTCRECASKYYGPGCAQTCSIGCDDICNKEIGTCTCKQGYKGSKCDACETGHYNSSGQCTPCGQGCQDSCDQQTGHCTCNPGWTPPFCQQECRDGFYGQNCSQLCAPGCAGACNKSDGSCTCLERWQPPGCTDCKGGYYDRQNGCKFPCGAGCVENVPCSTDTGTCACKHESWKPPVCQECQPGYWGGNCSSLCGNCAGNRACDQNSGYCTATGCVGEYEGPACTEKRVAPDNGGISAGPVAGGVAGVAIVIVIVVIVVVFVIRRKRQRKGKEARYAGITVDSRQDLISSETDGGTLSMTASSPPKVKPKVEVKPIKRDNSEKGDEQAAASHVYSNTAALNAEAAGNAHVYGNVPALASDVTGKTETGERPTPGPKAPPAVRRRQTGREHIYENVSLPPRAERTAGADSSPPSHVPSPKRRPPKAAKPRPEVDAAGTDDDDDYNSEDIYSSTKEMTSQHFDPFQQYLVKCLGSGQLAAQFAKLPKGMKHPHEVGMTDENKRKNRFKALCAYDYNRVILNKPEGDNSSDYINASYIKGAGGKEGKYIASQGPRDNTVGDLWWMVWQDKITQIVMLTNLQEEGKNKCEEYWPASGHTVRYDHVTVKGLKEEERADFCIRVFSIKVKKSSRQVCQYHYRAWPDHGVPQAASLVDFWRYVKGRSTPDVPLLVHCSAGVGRTGTFIGLDIAHDLESQGQTVNVNNIVKQLREERSLMVQSEAQYKFLHEVVLEAHSSRTTRIPVSQFNTSFQKDIHIDSENTKVDREFQTLKELGQFSRKPRHLMATDSENLDKNRNMDALPDDEHLVYLSVHARGRNQYINAVYLSSFHQRRGFILTQLPLPHTLHDFWRLVDGAGVSTVVSIGSKDEEQSVQDFCQFWPRNVEEPVSVGSYTITLSSVTSLSEHLSSSKLTLVNQSDGKSRTVELLRYWNWPDQVPSDSLSILHLVDTVKTIQTGHVTQPVIVQCIDGVAKSGLFCTLYDVLSRVTYDEEVDVFLTARQVQRVRPQAVATQAQYRFLYKAVQDYNRHLNVYQNADVSKTHV